MKLNKTQINFIYNKFYEKLARYNIKKYTISDEVDYKEFILLIEDSFAVVVVIEFKPSDGISYLNIEELTPKFLNIKYVHQKFIKKLESDMGISFLGLCFKYTKFRGYERPYWCLDMPTTAEYYDEKLPELNLRRRYDLWAGDRYKIMIIEIEEKTASGEIKIVSGANCIRQSPNAYLTGILKKAKKGQPLFTGFYRNGVLLERALKSWKGEKIIDRFVNHLSYYVVEEYFKEKELALDGAEYVHKKFVSGKIKNLSKMYYQKLDNKWKSEEMVYKLCKKIYGKDFAVIYQHRPFFLTSSFGGRMSYDVFITEINVAVEYQGKQHYYPVDFFGGEESHVQQVKRDKEKHQLSIKNGIALAYIKYNEDITEELIVDRVNKAREEIDKIKQ